MQEHGAERGGDHGVHCAEEPRALGVQPNTRYTTIDTRATASLVAAGLGVALNNGVLAYGHDLTGVAVLPTEPRMDVSIGIAAVKPEHRSPAAKRFLAFVLAHLPEK